MATFEAPQQGKKYQSWCWTLNNYTEDEVEEITGYIEKKNIQYLGFGKEVGAEGTPHL